MRQWLLAMAGTTLLATTGQIDPANSMYTANCLNWLSHLAGSAYFGFGMVLASGCGNKTLVRIGSGSLKSLVVFIVVGLSAFMTLKGILAIPRSRLLDSQFISLASHQDLPSIVDGAVGGVTGGIARSLAQMQLALGALAVLALLAFVFSSREFRARDVLAQNLTSGIVIGAVIAAGWYVSGASAT